VGPRHGYVAVGPSVHAARRLDGTGDTMLRWGGVTGGGARRGGRGRVGRACEAVVRSMCAWSGCRGDGCGETGFFSLDGPWGEDKASEGQRGGLWMLAWRPAGLGSRDRTARSAEL
jgi:hypothetical protein